MGEKDRSLPSTSERLSKYYISEMEQNPGSHVIWRILMNLLHRPFWDNDRNQREEAIKKVAEIHRASGCPLHPKLQLTDPDVRNRRRRSGAKTDKQDNVTRF